MTVYWKWMSNIPFFYLFLFSEGHFHQYLEELYKMPRQFKSVRTQHGRNKKWQYLIISYTFYIKNKKNPVLIQWPFRHIIHYRVLCAYVVTILVYYVSVLYYVSTVHSTIFNCCSGLIYLYGCLTTHKSLQYMVPNSWWPNWTAAIFFFFVNKDCKPHILKAYNGSAQPVNIFFTTNLQQ